MRTTIDLDPDVDARLRALARERGVPLRTVINDALRAGSHPTRATSSPYKVPVHALAVRPEIDITKGLQLVADLEDNEAAHKLDLRK